MLRFDSSNIKRPKRKEKIQRFDHTVKDFITYTLMRRERPKKIWTLPIPKYQILGVRIEF